MPAKAQVGGPLREGLTEISIIGKRSATGLLGPLRSGVEAQCSSSGEGARVDEGQYSPESLLELEEREVRVDRG